MIKLMLVTVSGTCLIINRQLFDPCYLLIQMKGIRTQRLFPFTPHFRIAPIHLQVSQRESSLTPGCVQ